MVTLSDITSCREQILDIARQHGASDIRLFGSVSRDTATAASDVDLLVRLDDSRTLLDQIALAQDLEDLLHVSVDVVDEEAIHPLVRDEVLAQAVAL